jgi:tetraacyldisaccharide 4'-kinase
VLERPQFWRRGLPGSAAVRALLTPVSWLYGAVVWWRNRRFDSVDGMVVPPACPTVSVGNLTVGGTGKTPVTAWIAAALASGGARVGIVLRGYGADEVHVLRRLVPSAVVVADPDRVSGIAEARREGATTIVLDDGFQHRRAGRHLDIVLLSADAADESLELLPAGPFREPVENLRRAGLVIVTRKAADDAAVAAVTGLVRRVAPAVPLAVLALSPDALHRWDGAASAPLSMLADCQVAAVSGIGEPIPFERQLAAAGARVTGFRYGDHHAFTAGDVGDLLRRVPSDAVVVCTLKDAVKLGPLWPDPAPPLWYLSQRITVERGAAAIDAALATLPQPSHPAST